MTKKIILASALLGLMMTAVLPALAQDNATTAGTPTPTPVKTPLPTRTPYPTPKPVDLACMQTAVEKRDTALSAAFTKYSDTVKTLLSTRMTELKAAWSITVMKDRRAAIKTAWEKYRKSIKAARADINKAKKDTWKVFNTDRKNCRGQADDTYGEAEDIAL